MSILDKLSTASMVRAPEGYRACVRAPVDGATLDELDAAVEAAEGWIERQALASAGLRPGRLVAGVQEATWYVVPVDAFET